MLTRFSFLLGIKIDTLIRLLMFLFCTYNCQGDFQKKQHANKVLRRNFGFKCSANTFYARVFFPCALFLPGK